MLRPAATGRSVSLLEAIWGVPEMVVPNGWFIRENPNKMDDLGVPLFQETSIWRFPGGLPQNHPLNKGIFNFGISECHVSPNVSLPNRKT